MLYGILAIISIIISLIFGIKEKTIVAGFTMLMVCFMLSLVIIAIFVGIGEMNMEYVNQTRVEYPIYGLEYQNEKEQYTNGTFILGIGSFNSGLKENKNYYFFSVTEYGKKLETLNGNQWDIYIKETDDEKPCLITIYQEQWFNDFFTKLLGKKVRKTIDTGKILVVPTNTLQIDYDVNI